MEGPPPAGGTPTVRVLSTPWCTTTIPGKSNGSNITDLPIASVSVENFGGGEPVKMSLKVALTVELLPGGGDGNIAIDWFERAKTRFEVPDTWEKEARKALEAAEIGVIQSEIDFTSPVLMSPSPVV